MMYSEDMNGDCAYQIVLRKTVMLSLQCLQGVLSGRVLQMCIVTFSFGLLQEQGIAFPLHLGGMQKLPKFLQRLGGVKTILFVQIFFIACTIHA